MSEVIDTYVTDENRRKEAIEKQRQAIEGPGGPPEAEIMPDFETALKQGLWLAALVTAPEATVAGYVGGETLHKIAQYAFPKHTTLQAGADLAGNVLGAILGDPSSREALIGEVG